MGENNLKWEKWRKGHYVANGLMKGHTSYDVNELKYIKGWNVEIKFVVGSLKDAQTICEKIEQVEVEGMKK